MSGTYFKFSCPSDSIEIVSLPSFGKIQSNMIKNLIWAVDEYEDNM